MKKLGLLLMMFLMIGSASVLAQGQGPKDQKMSKEEKDAKMIGFLTEKLSLTSEEAKDFWPVFNEMKDKLKENHKSFKGEKPGKDVKLDDMSDEEVRELIDNGFKMMENDIAIKKEYNEKFINILGVKRTAKLYHLEKEFKKNMKGEGHGPQGPPPPAPEED
ncbi:MAG: hypothetical protein H6600_04735 [Flavobacteriales bacterium]|nr:hypothetical protein [Flavobacteriales bacterium]MCB9196725.1 hypothetical protein [Flavobacteriales bacterium]MCB9197742.1 hypothetical protein [Flavobacteriales bacterium]